MDGGWNANFTSGGFDIEHGRAERSSWSKIERDGDSGKDALVIDGKSGTGRLVTGEGAEGHELAGSGGHIDRFESCRILLSAGHDFQDYVVLIETLVDGGDFALAESVAQSVVDRLHRDAESAGSIAIDDKRTFQPVHLLVGVDIAKLGNLGEP